MHPLTNYKFLDDVLSERACGLKIQQQQDILAIAWKPYMKDFDTIYADATCYKSEMRYSTDTKLLWKGIEKAYVIMCALSAKLNQHRQRTKYVDVEKAYLSYRKQRRHTKVQARKLTRRPLNLLEKILKETRRLERERRNGESADDQTEE